MRMNSNCRVARRTATRPAYRSAGLPGPPARMLKLGKPAMATLVSFSRWLSGSVAPVVFQSLIDCRPLEFVGLPLQLQIRNNRGCLHPVEHRELVTR